MRRNSWGGLLAAPAEAAARLRRFTHDVAQPKAMKPAAEPQMAPDIHSHGASWRTNPLSQLQPIKTGISSNEAAEQQQNGATFMKWVSEQSKEGSSSAHQRSSTGSSASSSSSPLGQASRQSSIPADQHALNAIESSSDEASTCSSDSSGEPSSASRLPAVSGEAPSPQASLQQAESDAKQEAKEHSSSGGASVLLAANLERHEEQQSITSAEPTAIQRPSRQLAPKGEIPDIYEMMKPVDEFESSCHNGYEWQCMSLLPDA